MVAMTNNEMRSRQRRQLLLEAALEYASRGWWVFPLHSPGRSTPCDCGNPKCSSSAKHPWTKEGWHEASRDPEQIRAWWRWRPFANIGIATGPSGLVVLDVDPRHHGEDALIELVRRHGMTPGERMVSPVMQELANTLMSATGGGGQHYLYRAPENERLPDHNGSVADLDGLDVKASGGYIVAPPSWHVSGPLYEWQDGEAWREIAIAPLPRWLLEVIRKSEREWRPKQGPKRPPSARRNRDGERPGAYWVERALVGLREGSRNERGFWLACQIRDDGVGQDAAEGLMVEYADRAPGGATLYSAQEALQSLRSAYRATPREPARSAEARSETRSAIVTPIRPRMVTESLPGVTEEPEEPQEPVSTATQSEHRSEHRTDMGNARRFAMRWGCDARYVSKWQQWLLWDGTRFLRDETDQVMRWAKATARAIHGEGKQLDDPEEMKETAKWAFASEKEARLNSMLSLAQSEPEINVAADALDADNWLLNCRNGILDLRNGRLLPHDRAQLCTKRVEADYEATATCSTWLRFLDTIFAGDQELIRYLQRAVGYSLTGDMSEQCLFVLHGTGSNGKSTFIETLTAILADYGSTTPTETLMVKRGEPIPSDVARLVGARFVAASESGDGRRLDEELVKRITGGDRMTARFLHRDWFEFRPILKLWLAVNHEPQIRGTDHGIWRRVRLIPYTVTIPDEQQDKSLTAKLLGERSGILTWAVQGCLAWQHEGGLRAPEKVVVATRNYRTRMDNIGQFLGEMTEQHATATTSARQLYGAYESWCQESGESQVTQHRFGRYLGEHGYHKERLERGIVWIGLRFKAPIEEPAPVANGLFS